MTLRSLLCCIALMITVAACAAVKTDSTVDARPANAGGGGAMNGSALGGSPAVGTAPSGGSTGLGVAGSDLVLTSCAPACADFPAAPIITSGVTANAPSLFGAPGSGSPGTGPCVREPQDGTLFPSNWLRPRFSFSASTDESLFEIRLHSELEKNDLVVYTDASSWTMPKDMWTGLAHNIVSQPITVTVRSVSPATGTVRVSATSKFSVAPVGVGGSIVYWTTSGVSALKGFAVGDEAVSTVLTPSMVDPTVKCIGCHVSTPDGAFIGMAANLAPDHADPASIAIRSGATQQPPPFLSASAKQMLGRPQQQVAAFSKAHWATGDHVALSLLQNKDIIWTDLEAASMDQGAAWGTIARTGDSGLPLSPSWSHDGTSIVYTSVSGAATTDTGLRILTGIGALYTVPYGDRKGGAATVLNGSNNPQFHAYYPAFAPDDRFVAFTRAPSSGINYDIPAAEIFMLPREGAALPTRLAANDPPQCANQTSPGVTNSWPKWAPTVEHAGGTSYYWLTFSSRRQGSVPQIFITGFTVDASGVVQSYPALYVWNQPATESNHTPAWDVFDIPVVK